MKTCSRCKQELPLDAFSIRRARSDGRQSYCRQCSRAYAAEHYRADKPQYYARNKTTREKITELIREFKTSNPCTDCGVFYPFYVMDFDHLPQYEKLFELSRAPRCGSLTAVQEEMAKCDLVCANCHRVRTFTRAA